ncbi:MAG: transposase, partial [Cyanobacteria bacterium J06588_4]
PLPWQSKQQLLSPGRVAQAFPTIIAVIGTMAKSPKTRGKSPGRQKGQFPSPHPRYPTVKKRFSRRQKSNSTPKVVT